MNGKTDEPNSKITIKQQYIATRKGTRLAQLQVRQGKAAIKKLIEEDNERELRLILLDSLKEAGLASCDRETLVEFAFFVLREFDMLYSILSIRETEATATIDKKRKPRKS